MPTYEYTCKTCGEHLEVVQSFDESALTECPSCGGPLRKVFGNIGITFKGSGFYRTDNRGNGHRSAAPVKADEGKASDGKASDGKASDGKASDGKAAADGGRKEAGAGGKARDAVASGAPS
jgi:putative FmdB family regulatory protein